MAVEHAPFEHNCDDGYFHGLAQAFMLTLLVI